MQSTLPSTGFLRLPQIIGTLAASPRIKEPSDKLDSSSKRDRKTEAPFYNPLISVSRLLGGLASKQDDILPWSNCQNVARLGVLKISAP